MTEMLSEPVRRIGAMIAVWGGWLGALGIFVYSTVSYDPQHGHFSPQWVSLSFVFAIGIAIAGTAARSRMRLASTIMSALEAGRANEVSRRDAEIK